MSSPVQNSTTQPPTTQAPTTQAPTTYLPAPPACEGEECEEIYDVKCVTYTGEPIPGLDIEPGDTLETIISKLIEYISKVVDISTLDTNTVALLGDGSSSDPLKANAKISTINDNFLTAEANGIAVVINQALVEKMLEVIIENPTLLEAFKGISITD